MTEGTNSRIGRTRKLLKVVNMAQGNTPQVEPTANRSDDFVYCGKRNLFREFLRSLADNCPPLAASINLYALYLAGRRLVFKDANNEEVQRATDVWNALHVEDGEAHFRKATAKDIALLGDRTWEAVMSRGGMSALYHIDAMRMRIGKKVDGRITKFYWCSNWELRSKYKAEYKEQEIPAFGSAGMRTAGKGILFARDYHQGQDYYGMPIYLSALTDAEVYARIAHFNRTQIDTGFRPSFHIHAITSADDENVEELDDNIEEVFTGPDGKAYALTTGTREEAPIITKLERGDHAGELDKMGDRAANVIYDAFGIPRILMGVETNTGLSGKGLAIEQSITQFLRTQIVPRQYLLTDDALRVVQMLGVKEAVSCEVEQIMPFDSATDAALQRQSYLRRTTIGRDLMNNGEQVLTTDGEPLKKDRSNYDQRNELLLIEAGTASTANMNEEDDAEKKTNEDDPDA